MGVEFDFKEFTKPFNDKIDRDIEGDIETYMRRGCLQALSNVVMESPVDSGRFRAAWIMSIGVTSAEVPQEEQEDYPAPGATISDGAAVLNSYSGYKIVYLQNNVEYGPALANGHSRQAPSGFVDNGVERAFPK